MTHANKQLIGFGLVVLLLGIAGLLMTELRASVGPWNNCDGTGNIPCASVSSSSEGDENDNGNQSTDGNDGTQSGDDSQNGNDSGNNNNQQDICSDGTDNDGDGMIDEDDPDCDSKYSIDESSDTCSDGIDNDNDGQVDDDDCDTVYSTSSEGDICMNGIDDDGDGMIDEDDPDCDQGATPPAPSFGPPPNVPPSQTSPQTPPPFQPPHPAAPTSGPATSPKMTAPINTLNAPSVIAPIPETSTAPNQIPFWEEDVSLPNSDESALGSEDETKMQEMNNPGLMEEIHNLWNTGGDNASGPWDFWNTDNHAVAPESPAGSATEESLFNEVAPSSPAEIMHAYLDPNSFWGSLYSTAQYFLSSFFGGTR